MKLSAIIPGTDQPPTLAACENAIAVSQEPPDEVVVIRDPSFGGPAQARNVGAQQATGDFLVFVDADVVVGPDAFSLIRAAFERDPNLTAVFGSYDDDPARHGLVSDFRNLLHHYVHQEGAGEAVTFWAGLGAVRREAFLAVGGFDEQRFPNPSIEDIDLGMRLVANGGRIVLDPNIQGKHLKRWTLANMVRTDFRRRGIPWVRLLLGSPAQSTALNLGWQHRTSALASVALISGGVTRRPRVTIVAAAALLTLNRRFYLLLLRRRGLRGAAAGFPLHVVHHLVSVAAVPAGTVLHLRERFNSGSADTTSSDDARADIGARRPL